MVDVDAQGFDYMDRKLLLTIIEKFMGGPVGLDNLAAAIGEEKDTIEDVIEPYLIQQGFIQRTPRGRIVSQHAYRHFGFEPPSNNWFKCLLLRDPWQLSDAFAVFAPAYRQDFNWRSFLAKKKARNSRAKQQVEDDTSKNPGNM